MSLRGVEFDWILNSLKSYGVIAQELEKVIPDIVNENNGVKSVNYNAIIGFLIESIKSHQNTIKTLEDRVSRLEKK